MERIAEVETAEVVVTCVNDDPAFYDFGEITAKLRGLGLKVADMTVRRCMAANQNFPTVRFGQKIFVLAGPVDQFLAEAATTATSLDIATWTPKTSAAPTPDFPQASGPRSSAGEDVA